VTRQVASKPNTLRARITAIRSTVRGAFRQHLAPIVAILFTVVVGVLAMLVAYPRMRPEDQDGFWADLGNAGMQAIVVAAAGGIVTAGLKYMEDQRETAQQAQDARREVIRSRNEYRLALLQRLRRAYSAIKRVRRELEIAGVKPASTDPFTLATGLVEKENTAAYHDGIAALREVKLDLEAMRDELKAGVGLEGSTPQLSRYLQQIEDYLDNEIIDEQRALLPAVTAADMPLAREQVPRLQQFVASTSVPGVQQSAAPFYAAFGSKVSGPYHEAARVLVTGILTQDPDTAVPAGASSAV
jgi:hypothetical protein